MIVDAQKTVNYIVKWLKDYAEKHQRKSLVCRYSPRIDSIVVFWLCEQTNLKTYAIANEDTYQILSTKSFAEDFGINFMVADVNSGESTEVVDELTPALCKISDKYKGLIVGDINRSEEHIIRNFQKYGNGLMDINPIADLFKSEIYELFVYLTNNSLVKPGNTSADNIYKENKFRDSTKDHIITYDEIEWADRENTRSQTDTNASIFPAMEQGILFRMGDPAKHPAWLGYTGRQREVIAKMHHLEKVSRHKINNNLPVCHLRSDSSLVR